MIEKSIMGSPEEEYQNGRTDNLDEKCFNGYVNQMMPVVNLDSQTILDGQPVILCSGCGTRILDRFFLLVADQHWHVPCLRCVDCNVQLDTQLTCFARDGNIFCKSDYYRRYSVRCCSRCGMAVSSTELVMRAKDLIFHLACFSCVSCNRLLTTGDHFGLHCDMIYCQEDYEMLFQEIDFHRLSPGLSPGPGLLGPVGPGFYSAIGCVQKGRPRKRKNGMPDHCIPGMGLITNEHGEIIARDAYCNGQQPRQKRVRTSFKHHQLRTMKSYFALNHNPDAKDLKQLSQKTQLSKRVLQVWFQNARAKHRRNNNNPKSENGTQNEKEEKSPPMTMEEAEKLLDLSTCTPRSPTSSEVSSSQSVADSVETQERLADHSSDSLTELFADEVNVH